MQKCITKILDIPVFEIFRVHGKCGGIAKAFDVGVLKKIYIRVGGVSRNYLELAFSNIFGMCKEDINFFVSQYRKIFLGGGNFW